MDSSACKYFVSNRYARIILGGYEEILGRKQFQRVLAHAGLDGWLAKFPPDNLEFETEFASCSALAQAVEDLYGRRGGCGLAIRAGRAAVPELLHAFGSQAGIDQASFKLLPLREKIAAGLDALGSVLGAVSSQPVQVSELPDRFVFSMPRCAACWGRGQAAGPVCWWVTGLLQEWVRWLAAGQEWQVVETCCIAAGDEACEFTIPKTAA